MHPSPSDRVAPASVVPVSAVRAVAARLVEEWRAEAARRQAVSRHDPTGDVFTYCAAQLARVLEEVSPLDEMISPAEYAALEHVAVDASTVRRWCNLGLLEHHRAGRNITIRRGAAPPDMAARRSAAA